MTAVQYTIIVANYEKGAASVVWFQIFYQTDLVWQNKTKFIITSLTTEYKYGIPYILIHTHTVK